MESGHQEYCDLHSMILPDRFLPDFGVRPEHQPHKGNALQQPGSR